MAILPMGLSLLNAAGGSILSNWWNASTTPAFTPGYTATQYNSWFNRPIVEPNPDQLIQAWKRGTINASTLTVWLKDWGIDVPPTFYQNAIPPDANPLQRLWRNVARSWLSPTPIDVLLRYYRMGAVDLAYVDDQLRLHGINVGPVRDRIISPRIQLGPADTVASYHRFFLDRPLADKMLQTNGHSDENVRELMIKLGYNWPSLPEVFSWYKGFTWSDELATLYGLDIGYNADVERWSRRHAFAWTPNSLGITLDQGGDKQISKLLYRNHWRMLMPHEAMRAIQSLREEVPGSGQTWIDGVPAFDRSDFDNMLKAAGYPRTIRDWLYGMSFEPVGIRQVRLLFMTYSWSRDDVKKALTRTGHREQDAEALTRELETLRWRKEIDPARRQLAADAKHAFRAGVLNANEMAPMIFAASIPTQTRYNQFVQQPVQQQQTTAAADPATNLVYSALLLERATDRANALRAAVHKAYVRREIDSFTALNTLNTAGIDIQRINEDIEIWNLEIQANGKEATASQIIAWVKRGIITTGQAAQRLSIMGYNSMDINAMLAVALQDIAIARQRQAERDARTAQQRLRAQQAQLREMERNRQRIIAQLNRDASKAAVLKFYKEGLISRGEAAYALATRGIDAASIELWLRDTDIARQKEKEQANPAK